MKVKRRSSRHLRGGRMLSMILALCIGTTVHAAPSAKSRPAVRKDAHAVPVLIDDLQRRTFDFFAERADPRTGLVPDRWPSPSFSSIAAVGFGLTSYGVGVERGWMTRQDAARRTLATLRFFDGAKQGDDAHGASGNHGFFYHFLEMSDGTRSAQCELSSVDTAWLIAGALFAQSYFDRDNADEREIRQLAERLYQRVDWTWMQVRKPLISMGWKPESGFIHSDWEGYNEALMVYVLALASPTHPVERDAYDAWTRTYNISWGEFRGQTYLSFPPLFGHQYSHVWIDFRGIRDDWARGAGIDYFENSRRAVLAHRAYAIANPMGWRGYGADIWGLTPSDGPADVALTIDGVKRQFHTYTARGVGREYSLDDGTIAPTAAAGSMPFAPDVVIPAIEAMHARYGKAIYGRYGFFDAFNPTMNDPAVKLQHGHIVDGIWVDRDYLGIDQGPIVLMTENYRSGLVWKVMRRNPHIVRGLKRAGFSGGWLAEARG